MPQPSPERLQPWWYVAQLAWDANRFARKKVTNPLRRTDVIKEVISRLGLSERTVERSVFDAMCDAGCLTKTSDNRWNWNEKQLCDFRELLALRIAPMVVFEGCNKEEVRDVVRNWAHNPSAVMSPTLDLDDVRQWLSQSNDTTSLSANHTRLLRAVAALSADALSRRAEQANSSLVYRDRSKFWHCLRQNGAKVSRDRIPQVINVCFWLGFFKSVQKRRSLRIDVDELSRAHVRLLALVLIEDLCDYEVLAKATASDSSILRIAVSQEKMDEVGLGIQHSDARPLFQAAFALLDSYMPLLAPFQLE